MLQAPWLDGFEVDRGVGCVKPNLRFDDIICLGCDTKGVNWWEECDIMLQALPFGLMTFTTKNPLLHPGAGCFQPRLAPMKTTPGLLRST